MFVNRSYLANFPCMQKRQNHLWKLSIHSWKNCHWFILDKKNNTWKIYIFILQRILEDIENRKGKALLVAEKQTELQKSGKPLARSQPSSKLTTEISDLQQLAREQCETLREAVAQQAQYERDIGDLTAAINEAQEKLLTSPVEASDVGSLKKQIEEHNVSSDWILLYSYLLANHCFRLRLDSIVNVLISEW